MPSFVTTAATDRRGGKRTPKASAATQLEELGAMVLTRQRSTRSRVSHCRSSVISALVLRDLNGKNRLSSWHSF